uniref:Uncharacterized protein n=1 Tax=Arundo donax TaxID=35708 RepID=A0A0A8ZPX1_ARUDO
MSNELPWSDMSHKYCLESRFQLQND